MANMFGDFGNFSVESNGKSGEKSLTKKSSSNNMSSFTGGFGAALGASDDLAPAGTKIEVFLASRPGGNDELPVETADNAPDHMVYSKVDDVSDVPMTGMHWNLVFSSG